ncbi:MAG: pyridoxal 5'-phosphate synthase glutaminase subunit PdxT [Proteobacteria bacterium]|nr:pyridoxal 5'-phosphate synthase glutaminase subunit PdxT [Pseudomonadota bacterium]
MKKRIGVLALQGCVEPHKAHIEALGCEFVAVRKSSDFENLSGLILPGGESSTILKLLKVLEMENALENALKKIPSWGICAGAILMAQKVIGFEQKSFGALPIGVRRNAYGRQLDSFNTEIANYEVSYIRAPIIEELINGPQTEVLAKQNEKATWIVSGKNMATTFHPELNLKTPSPMHQYFLEHCILN